MDQEMRVLAWLWFLRLARLGKNVAEFLTVFTTFLARAVNSGRRLVGTNKTNDVMCPKTQKRQGFRVESLSGSAQVSHDRLCGDPHGQEAQDAWEERLKDNTLSPVPDQAAFRIDFPNWHRTRCYRDRQIIDCMLLDHRTQELSRIFGISPGRISQLRREYHDDWQWFQGEHQQDSTAQE